MRRSLRSRGRIDATAIGMSQDIRGVDTLMRSLRALPAQGRECALRGLTRSVLIVHRDAVRNAPRSPMAKIIASRRKTTRDTSGLRDPRATSRAKPGGLERSIEWAVDADALSASVYVAANSEAGEYAARIHDERGQTWQDLGPGSIAKGDDVGEKFIARAVKANENDVKRILEQELQRGLKL